MLSTMRRSVCPLTSTAACPCSLVRVFWKHEIHFTAASMVPDIQERAVPSIRAAWSTPSGKCGLRFSWCIVIEAQTCFEKGNVLLLHLQNLLVPACCAALAGDNLEAARVSGKLWSQAFHWYLFLYRVSVALGSALVKLDPQNHR